MHKLLSCRRTFITFVAILALTAIALHNNMDTSIAIATTAAALAGANSWEGRSNNGK